MGLPVRREEVALRFRDGAWRMDRRDRRDGRREVAIRGTPEELVHRLREAVHELRGISLEIDASPGQYTTATLQRTFPRDAVTFTLWPDGDRTLVSAEPAVTSRVAWLWIATGALTGLMFVPQGGALVWIAGALAAVAGTLLAVKRAFLNEADIRRGEALANHLTCALEGRIHEGEQTDDPFREE